MTDSHDPVITVNGSLTASISALDRGLAFGDGVFETMRVVAGTVPLWDSHRQRLIRGARRLRLNLAITSIEQWQQQLLSQLAGDAQGIFKLQVTRGVGGRGYQIDPGMQCTVVCQFFEQSVGAPQPLELHVCEHRLPLNHLLAGIKHLNRLDNVLLRAECQDAGRVDGLVRDSQGNILETTSCNLFFERDGALYTPDLSGAGVQGVARQLIIDELAPAAGLKVQEGSWSLPELPMFDGVFACNSVRGIQPVVAVLGRDTRHVFPRSALADALQHRFLQRLGLAKEQRG